MEGGVFTAATGDPRSACAKATAASVNTLVVSTHIPLEWVADCPCYSIADSQSF